LGSVVPGIAPDDLTDRFQPCGAPLALARHRDVIQPFILNRVLAQDKERTNKSIDSALGHLRQLGLTDEQTIRLLVRDLSTVSGTSSRLTQPRWANYAKLSQW